MAGVTDQGFEPETEESLLAKIEADEKATVDPLIDVRPTSRLGQINLIFARQLALLWGAAADVYASNDPDKAFGDGLTSIGKLTGTPRRGASYSTVDVQVNLDQDGVSFISGQHFVQRSDDPRVRFTPAADFTSAPGDTSALLQFRAENRGAVAAPAGSLTTITTPISGWTAATNASDAELGRPIDDDKTLHDRREEQLTAAGSSTMFAIASDLDQLAGIESAEVFVNDSDFLDLATGLPPHSFECLIWDGSPPVGVDNDIAQTIWDSKPAGIRPFGTGSSGPAFDRDSAGNLTSVSHTVPFSRVTQATVYLTYDLTTGAGYGGDSAFKAAIAEAANALFDKVGATLYASHLLALAFMVPGVVDVVSLKLGFSSTPTNTGDLTLAPRDLARFDSSRIVVI